MLAKDRKAESPPNQPNKPKTKTKSEDLKILDAVGRYTADGFIYVFGFGDLWKVVFL